MQNLNDVTEVCLCSVCVCACVCALVGSLSGHPAASRASQGDHPAGGGGAGTPPEPDTATTTADPHQRQENTQSTGQKHTNEEHSYKLLLGRKAEATNLLGAQKKL